MVEQELTDYVTDCVENEDWTFATADTRYMTHGIHPYPARMIPQVARKLIDMFATGSQDVAIDPYCGSGTVLVESKLKGIRSIGVDANPLAALIAKVKMTPIDPALLYKEATTLIERIAQDMKSRKVIDLPNFKGIDYWFKLEVSSMLIIIRDNIDRIEDGDVRDFFKICFSLTVRKSSNTRPGEFKLYRIPPEKLKLHNPNVMNIFSEIVENNISKMKAFVNALPKEHEPAYIVKGDTRKLLSLNPKIIHEDCANLLVTSPPYGDSHTTVAYGQFSRYSSAWLGFPEEEVWKVDKVALGGKVFTKMDDLESPTLLETLEAIRKGDEFRAKETYAFFKDIDICFAEIAKVMRKGKSHICYVLGNRTVKRVRVPADQILIELGAKYGLKHITTKHREIPNKRLPSENAPENLATMKGETMTKENIVIWQY